MQTTTLPVPKIVGLETEFGIALRNQPASIQATAEFFHEACPHPIPWDHQLENPAKDARDFLSRPSELPGVERETSTDSAVDSYRPISPSGFHLTIQHNPSTILSNGARFYIDHAHPEYCTPECLNAREAVAYDKAGESILKDMVKRTNALRAPENQVVLYKNNSDHQGNSYGCHENYLMAANVYEDLFNNKAHWLYSYIIPFLVSRQIICGAGKVGAENGSIPVEYQISQRADFLECVIGLQTMHHRPIINTRDEPHARSNRYRRLHVICGDANMAEWSTYLKVGTMQLVLTMLEAGQLHLDKDVTLADPLAAFKHISCDPKLKIIVPMEHGQRHYSALQIQRLFIERARNYLDNDESAKEQWNTLLEDWAWVIQSLETDPSILDSYLDWRIKQKFLQSQIIRKGLSWGDIAVREMDIRYHQLDDSLGFFYLLQRAKFVTNLLPVGEIEKAMVSPPLTTRAYLRGLLVQQYPEQIISANWEKMTLAVPSGLGGQSTFLSLNNPINYTASEIGTHSDETPLANLMTHLQTIHKRKVTDGVFSPSTEKTEYTEDRP